MRIPPDGSAAIEGRYVLESFGQPGLSPSDTSCTFQLLPPTLVAVNMSVQPLPVGALPCHAAITVPPLVTPSAMFSGALSARSFSPCTVHPASSRDQYEMLTRF